MNKIIIMGRVGQQPEGGQAGSSNYLKFSVATSETWKDKQGQKQEKTTWHNCIIWGARAHSLHSYINKGDMVAIEGKQEHEKKEHNGETRYFSQIKVEQFHFVGGNKKEQPTNKSSQNTEPSDLPF